jgi:hypothetical protein
MQRRAPCAATVAAPSPSRAFASRIASSASSPSTAALLSISDSRPCVARVERRPRQRGVRQTYPRSKTDMTPRQVIVRDIRASLTNDRRAVSRGQIRIIHLLCCPCFRGRSGLAQCSMDADEVAHHSEPRSRRGYRNAEAPLYPRRPTQILAHRLHQASPAPRSRARRPCRSSPIFSSRPASPPPA